MSANDLQPITPEEAVEWYLNDRRPEVSEATIKAHGYRLSHFVRWCEQVEQIENMNVVTGRHLLRYKNWRREDGGLNNVTMQTQLSTLRVFVRWCERVDAVENGLSDKIILPTLKRNEDRRDDILAADRAKSLLTYLRRFKFATRSHAFIEVLWHTGMRVGALHSLDLDDFDEQERTLRLRHRPETGTRLKNAKSGERFVSISEQVADVLTAYVEVNRIDSTDEYGREPLFTSGHGRVSKGTFRDNTYQLTRPCVYDQHCPHDRDPETCEAMDRNRASKCPSSLSPHAIRRGSITHHLSNDVPEKVVSDRMNVSLDVLDKHYDQRGEREKAEQRRGYLDNI